MNNIDESWKKFLNPNTLKDNLISVSLYIMTFEIMKDNIEGKVDTFFNVSYSDNKKNISDEYNNEVLSLLSRKEKTYYVLGSLRWLKNMNIFDENDLEIYEELRLYRNDLTHDFQKYLIDIDNNFEIKKMKLLANLFVKLEKKWIKEFEICLNPDFDYNDVRLEDISSMQILVLNLISDIALNNEPDEFYYYKIYESLKKQMSS